MNKFADAEKAFAMAFKTDPSNAAANDYLRRLEKFRD
jgi:hypothetical protein